MYKCVYNVYHVKTYVVGRGSQPLTEDNLQINRAIVKYNVIGNEHTGQGTSCLGTDT